MTEFTTALHSVLADYELNGSPYFAKVFKGEPSALAPLQAPIARWHTVGTRVPPEGARVLTGKRQVAAIFEVNCYWPLTALEGAQHSQEDDIAVATIDLPAAMVALTPNDDPKTYSLGSYTVNTVTVEDPSPVQRAFIFPNSDFEARIFSFEVWARIPEAA